MFTRIGACAFVVFCTVSSWYFAAQAGVGFSGYLPYLFGMLVLVPLFMIALFFCAEIGQAFADWCARIVFRNRLRSESVAHRAIYFLVSCFGMAIGVLIVWAISLGGSDNESVPLVP